LHHPAFGLLADAPFYLHYIHAHAHSEHDQCTRDHDFFASSLNFFTCLFSASRIPKDPSTLLDFFSSTFLFTDLGAFLLFLLAL